MAHILILKRAHFFSIDNDLIDVHAKTIGATALAVYTALARFVNRKTGECWPSIARLAHLLDLARNTVKTALRKLEAAGLIAIRRRRAPAGDATSHLYTLLDASPHAVEARLARRAADVLSAEGGGSAADPPPVNHCSTSGAPRDPEPSSPQHKRENQDDRAGCTEDTPKPPTKNPCPHPVDERRHFGAMTLCTHCYQMIDVHDDATREDMTPGQEGQAGTRAA